MSLIMKLIVTMKNSVINLFRRQTKEKVLESHQETENKNEIILNPDEIMTLQEIHEFGIDIISNYVEKEGYKIVACSLNINENPQLVIRKNEVLYLVAGTAELVVAGAAVFCAVVLIMSFFSDYSYYCQLIDAFGIF